MKYFSAKKFMKFYITIPNKAKTAFVSIWKITGKYPSQVSVVKDANRKIITDLDAAKARWRDYFSQLYNDPNEVNEELLDNIQDSCDSENIPGIGEDELLAAILNWNTGKQPD